MAIIYVERPFVIKTEEGSSATLTQETGIVSDTQVVVIHGVTDDGAGSFISPMGTVNYGTGVVVLKVVDNTRTTESYKSDHDDASDFETSVSDGEAAGGSTARKGGEYGTESVSEEILAGTTVHARYSVAPAVPVAKSFSFAPPAVTIDLCPLVADYIVPGSVRFTWMGETYDDFEGVIYRGRTGGSPGVDSGTINYASGIVQMSDYVVGASPGAVAIVSLWTRRTPWTTASIFMRTQVAPLKPAGFVMTLTDSEGDSITATAGLDGFIDGTHLRGKIDYETGVVELQFGDYVLDSSLSAEQKLEWWYDADDVGAVEALKIWRPWPVDPTTLRYNSVAYFYLPLDADILGLDPVRLPQDGRVPIFRPGGFAVVGHTATTTPATVSNAQTIDLARTRLSRVRVIGSDGDTIETGYTTNLEAGTVTFTDVTGYSQPVTIEHRIEDMAQVSDVQITGQLGFTRQLTHDFPVPGSYVSGALIAGDLRSRVSTLFDQGSWDGATWANTVDGPAATGTYNDTLAPIAVTNDGAVTERWAFRFTSSTAFQIIGEHVGVIGTNTINADTAPINPATGTPYFTISELGWGSGWSVGNIVRMNTVGAQFPVWVARTIQQGPEAGSDYSFSLLTRGDVDNP